MRRLLTTTLSIVWLTLGLFVAQISQAEGVKNMNEEAVIGGGCFWCIEAIYQGFKGIIKVESGYAGGKVPNPSYERVSVGTTGHAEVVKITFDPSVISYKDIITIFFHAHDPTTKDRQGADVGSQYRSVILYSSPEQMKIAAEVKTGIEKSALWGDKPILTEISQLDQFYKAEDYHQNYYQQNKEKPYCSLVIAPKLNKIYHEFKDKLKPELAAKVN